MVDAFVFFSWSGRVDMKGWRTIIWNVLNAVTLGMEHVMSISGTGYAVPDDYMPLWVAVFATVNVLLRFKTDTPVGRSQ